VDISAWIENLMLDTSCKITLGQDVGAIALGSKLHPGSKRINYAIRFVNVYIQFRLLLPRFFSYMVEKIPGFVSHSLILGIPFIGPLIVNRLEKGSDDDDVGEFFAARPEFNFA
jgi:hypothetical protein